MPGATTEQRTHRFPAAAQAALLPAPMQPRVRRASIFSLITIALPRGLPRHPLLPTAGRLQARPKGLGPASPRRGAGPRHPGPPRRGGSSRRGRFPRSTARLRLPDRRRGQVSARPRASASPSRPARGLRRSGAALAARRDRGVGG